MESRRRYERVQFYCDIAMTPLPEGQTVPAYSFDLSLGGVGVMADVALPRGHLVRLDFHLKDRQQNSITETILGNIAYSKADEDGNRLGIEFLEPIHQTAAAELTRRLQEI